MRIDLHVHTNRYSKCSFMTPEEMAEAALAAGLEGVVITEHNTIWAEEELQQLQRQYPELLLMRAFEVSAENKHDVLVYGVTDTSRFSVGMPVREVVDIAHTLGGYVVLAHPFRFCEKLRPEVLNCSFDACEAHSINIDPLQHQLYMELAASLGVPYLHNSDGHFTISLGGYYNDFHTPIHNETELLAALRAQTFSPQVEPKFAQPALDFRYGKIENRIRRLIEQGITDPDALYAKVGGSRDRIQSVLQAALDAKPGTFTVQ